MNKIAVVAICSGQRIHCAQYRVFCCHYRHKFDSYSFWPCWGSGSSISSESGWGFDDQIGKNTAEKKHNDGKISPAWWEGGVHGLSLFLPSLTKLWCMLQLRGQIHSPYFYSSSIHICTLCYELNHRLEMDIFLHTFCHDGNFSPACWSYIAFSTPSIASLERFGYLYLYSPVSPISPSLWAELFIESSVPDSWNFGGGSGSGSADPCLWLVDPDPDPAIFDLQDASKKLIFYIIFSALYF